MIQFTHLNQDEILNRACKAIKGLSARQRRIALYLAEMREASTGTLSVNCQCGNISAAVQPMQEHLRKHGLFIRHYYPESGRLNKFGEPTRAHIWELVGYEEAK